MGNYNKVVLVGNLTKDPQLKYVLNGVAVSNYSLAVNRPYKDNDGNRGSDFIRVVCWKRLAELSEKYLKKGDSVLVEGALQSRTYEKEGQTHFATEVLAQKIEFLNTKRNKLDTVVLDETENKEEIPF